MNSTQQKLVKAASLDSALSGTRWRDRMDRWLDEKRLADYPARLAAGIDAALAKLLAPVPQVTAKQYRAAKRLTK